MPKSIKPRFDQGWHRGPQAGSCGSSASMMQSSIYAWKQPVMRYLVQKETMALNVVLKLGESTGNSGVPIKLSNRATVNEAIKHTS